MLDGPSVSSFMVEDDSPLFVLVVSPHRKYLAVELVKAASPRHFSGTMLDISHSRTGFRRHDDATDVLIKIVGVILWVKGDYNKTCVRQTRCCQGPTHIRTIPDICDTF